MAGKQEERLKEISERLEQGVQELFTSEMYTEYLKTMSQFHNYSFNNTLLIAMQKPDATLVAGYQAWQKKFNRHVKRGEKGIQIIAPVPVKEKEEREKIDEQTGEPVLKSDGQPETEVVEYVVPRFRVATVFDLSQTDGDPLPEIEVNELTANVENYALFMEALQRISPASMRFDVIESGAKGYYHNQNKEIVIQSGMSESQTMKTGVHEVTHARLHDRDRMEEWGEQKNQMTREVEAESVAYIVCQQFGLDTSDYSFPYIAGWSSGKDMKELRSSMDTIRHTAAEFIDELTETMQSLEREKGVFRESEEVLLVPDSSGSRYVIYQLDENGDGIDKRFMNLSYIENHSGEVAGEEYALVYSGVLSPEETLDEIYARFNQNHPEGFAGHSLSVSDVVVLNRDGEVHAFYVDSVGFPELPKFVQQRKAFLEEKNASLVTEQTEGLAVDGHEGTWHTVDQITLGDETFFLMEHDEFGDEAACIAVNAQGKLVAEDLWNGFDEGFHEAVAEYFSEQSVPQEKDALSEQERPAAPETPETVDSEKMPEPDYLDAPVYYEPFAYARENGEVDLFRLSKHLNVECRDAIEQAVRENFDGMHLNHDAAKGVLAAYGKERTALVLANTIRHKDYDGRFSRDNKKWAMAVQMPQQSLDGYDHTLDFIVESHPAVLDGFIDLFRQDVREQAREAPAQESARPFIDHFYVVEDLNKRGQLDVYEYSDFNAALNIYLGFPNHQMKAFGVQNTSPLPGSLDLIQCKNGIDTVLQDYKTVEGWDNPEISALVKQIEENLPLPGVELAYETDRGYFTIQTADDGYDYTFYDKDFHEIDGGILENRELSPQAAIDEIMEDMGWPTEERRVVSYENLMERVDTAAAFPIQEEQQIEAIAPISDRTEPEVSLHGQSMAAVEETVLCYAQAQIDEMGLHDEVKLLGARVYGSRSREGLYHEGSDVDVVLSYSGNIREDSFFNILHEDGLSIAGIAVDINPISAEEQTLEQYMQEANRYLNEKAAQMETLSEPEKPEPKISFYVAECMEFPVLGEYHENLTLQEAVNLYEKIPAERMSGIKGIGFDLQDGSIYDGTYELMSAGVVHTEDVNSIPHYRESPLVQKALSEIQALFPEQEQKAQEHQSSERHLEEKTAVSEPVHEPEKTTKPERTEMSGTGKKESVLKALRERQAKLKQQEQTKQKTQTKKRGEQEL